MWPLTGMPSVLQLTGNHSHLPALRASPSLPREWSNKGVAWITALEACKVKGGILGSGRGHGVFLPSHPPVSLRSEWTGQVNAGQHALQIPSEPQGLQLEPGGEDPQDSGDQGYRAR